MSKLAIVATTFVAFLGRGQTVFAEEAGRRACGLSTGTDALNAGRPIFYPPSRMGVAFA